MKAVDTTHALYLHKSSEMIGQLSERNWLKVKLLCVHNLPLHMRINVNELNQRTEAENKFLFWASSAMKAVWATSQIGFKAVRSYDDAKKNIILCIWCNAVFMWFIIFHILYIIVAPLCSSFLKRIQSSSFWKTRRALIGQLSSALWLAEYLKRETEMLHPLPYCDAVTVSE